MKSFVEEDQALRGMYWVTDAGACSGVYILEDGRSIIDTGNMYGLIDELQDLGPLEKLERILFTHSHFDHIGGVEEIYQVSSPDIYVHSAAREYLRLHRPPFPAFFDALEESGKMKLLKDGDLIEGAPPLRVIYSPGHTAGDLCFFDQTSGALFSGDAVLPHKLKLGPTLTKPDDVCGGLMREKLDTLRRLLRLPVKHLFPGHGEPVFHKGAAQIKLALYSAYQSLNEDQPEKAWVAMGGDLLEAGMPEDARQCAAKAAQLVSDAPEVRDLLERIDRGSL